MNFAIKARFLLIRLGKVAPFVVCMIVALSYIEDICMLSSNNFIQFYDGVYVEKPISWFIGNYFKYDIGTIFVLVVLSFAIETCVYNKMACGYLGVNLMEKSFFDFELEPTMIYVICIANIIVAWYLIWKGFRILLK